MDTITFVVHPEWIKEEDQQIYRDLSAALRVSITHLQAEKQDWNITMIRSDALTLTVSVKAGHSLKFIELVYNLAGEAALLSAMDWLRVAEYELLPALADLAEPSKEPTPGKKNYLDELCALPMMQEYPMLADCLRTQAKTIRMLKKMGLAHCAWDQNLLVAIDDDDDFKQFLEALDKVYFKERVISLPKNHQFRTFTTSSWRGLWHEADRISKTDPDDDKTLLYIIDVRNAGFQDKISTIQSELRHMVPYKKNFLCIFRTQVQEPDLIERMVDEFNDFLPVRAVIAPPMGADVLTGQFISLVEKSGCSFPEDCSALIEQWIAQERRSADDWRKLIERMSRELFLQKARSNTAAGVADMNITPDDIRSCMGIGDEIGDSRRMLNDLIGVENIKQRVLEITAQIKVQKELAGQGLERPAIHMMFTGNPGTGKTMVARIIASILREEGVLTKGLLYEVNARELCDKHVGHTAPLVAAKCRDAYGSVLFVDEAYTLHQDDGYRDFGREAIATLMTEMENHRDDFCVILAGYPKEMEHLMTANQGLQSRIPYTIDFPNYTRDELCAIFLRMAEGKFAYDESLKHAAEEFFNQIPQDVMDSPSFSNARMVRNLYERVWGKAAYRKVLNKEKELILKGEDLTAAVGDHDFRRLVETPSKKRPIGFSM